jgi:predicted porin
MASLIFFSMEIHMFSKKTVVAAASLLAAFAAQAQVNVYGNVDLFVGSVKTPGNKAQTEVRTDVATGSFIGFKGQEDLGGGLKAGFKLESSISADTGAATGGASSFWNRTSELSLSGGFGTVQIGNSLALGFLANNTFNPFSATGLANTSQTLNGHGPAWTNAVTYTSPNLSGFSAAVQLQFKESSAAGAKDNYGLQLNYGAGPLALGFTYSDEASQTKARWQLGGSYDFGVAKGFAQYGQNKTDGVTAQQKFFQVGVAVPLSASDAVVASFSNSKQASAKQRDFTVAYDHSLSKRTGVYVAAKNLYDNSKTPKSGTTFGVGIRHAF